MSTPLNYEILTNEQADALIYKARGTEPSKWEPLLDAALQSPIRLPLSPDQKNPAGAVRTAAIKYLKRRGEGGHMSIRRLADGSGVVIRFVPEIGKTARAQS